jgi:hypothetical protein
MAKLNEKMKVLKDENTKLKELLNRNEAVIESRIAESKLEQQHIITLCNLMGPIIQALNTTTGSNLSFIVLPRNFQELITQLDEINKQFKSGSLMTA